MFSFSCSGSAEARARPDEVWAAWIDVKSWSDGDVFETAHLNQSFKEGNTIFSKTRGFPAITLTITRVEAPRVWVAEAPFMGGRVTSEHLIEQHEDGTRLTERLTYRGPLAALAARTVRRRLEAMLAGITKQMARRAEEGAER